MPGAGRAAGRPGHSLLETGPGAYGNAYVRTSLRGVKNGACAIFPTYVMLGDFLETFGSLLK